MTESVNDQEQERITVNFHTTKKTKNLPFWVVCGMTDNYLHFDESDFAKANEVQDSLLEPVQEKTREETAGDSKPQEFAVVLVGDRKTA
jgi:hypothetical protein